MIPGSFRGLFGALYICMRFAGGCGRRTGRRVSAAAPDRRPGRSAGRVVAQEHHAARATGAIQVSSSSRAKKPRHCRRGSWRRARIFRGPRSPRSISGIAASRRCAASIAAPSSSSRRTARFRGNERFKTRAKAAGAAVLTAFDGPEARPGSERCLSATSAAPPVTVVPASDLRQIVQTPTAIVIASEELHEARVVRMNAKHGPPAERRGWAMRLAGGKARRW